MSGISLYIHIPFCRRKCGYCDFYSVVPDAQRSASLVDAVGKELDAWSRSLGPGQCVRTVFVGGGTPTAINTDSLCRLFDHVAQFLRRRPPSEFTVEANPETLNQENLDVMQRAGVTRVSLGAQSFRLDDLAVLERNHSVGDIDHALALIRRSAIREVNLDLIFGIPGQTVDAWGESLERAIASGVTHLACYGLTYEPGTRLYDRRARGEVRPCGEDEEAAMYELAIQTLTDAGFEHYEVSNFAKPGSRCLHNLAYWHNQPYVGVGPSAASYVDGERSRNIADVDEYVRRIRHGESPVIEAERLSGRARAGETAMLRLRLTEGIDRARFTADTGLDPVELFADPIRSHAAGCRIAVTPTHIRLTPAGFLIADVVIADFIRAASG